MTTKDVFDGFFEREGGWGVVTNHAHDRGGLTHSGVTLASYNAYLRQAGQAPYAPDEFVAGFTRGQAEAFLTHEFVRPFAFITDESIRVFLVDWAMTSGIDDPARALQAQMKARDLYRAAVDGVPGPVTRAAWLMVRSDLDELSSLELHLILARVEFYFDVAMDAQAKAFLKATPTTQLHNLRGWTRRALRFLV